MRVTRIIREYVEESIRSKYPCTDTEEYTAAKKLRGQMVEEYKKAIVNFADEMCKILNEKYQPNEEWKLVRDKDYSTAKLCSVSYKNSISVCNDTHRSEIVKKREEAIKHILITLEMGGTKEDLDRMIKEA